METLPLDTIIRSDLRLRKKYISLPGLTES